MKKRRGPARAAGRLSRSTVVICFLVASGQGPRLPAEPSGFTRHLRSGLGFLGSRGIASRTRAML